MNDGLLDGPELRWWLDLAPTLDWTFAKTMKETPHEYIVKGKQLDDATFERAVRVVRRYGEPGKFYQRTQVYLVHKPSELRWWTMGEPLHECQIINRAPWDQQYGKQDAPRTFSGLDMPYDELAATYDGRFTDPVCLAENKAVQRLVGEHAGQYAPKVLDIGAGTGLALDLGLTHPSLYTAVEPSQAMLNEMVRKHNRAVRLFPGRWEDMARKVGQGYDVVVSLFGSPSYIDPAFIPAIPSLTTSRGLTVLMFCREGYWPHYDRYRPETADEAREAGERIPGARCFDLNNMRVVTVRRD